VNFKSILVAAVAVVGLAPGYASATTITNLGQVSANTSGLLIAGSGVSETSSSNAPQSIGANSGDPSGWDPWGGADTNSNWLSVGGCCGGSGSYATFSFTSSENTFTLLWGSPNSDNTVTLYSGQNGNGSVIDTVSFIDGTGYYVDGVLSPTTYGPNTMDPGDLMSINSSGLFQSAELTNDIGGFEIADVSASLVTTNRTSTTPLPPTWAMLLGGLAMIGFLAHRGMTKQSTAATAV
jgi:hypothetical protein